MSKKIGPGILRFVNIFLIFEKEMSKITAQGTLRFVGILFY